MSRLTENSVHSRRLLPADRKDAFLERKKRCDALQQRIGLRSLLASGPVNGEREGLSEKCQRVRAGAVRTQWLDRNGKRGNERPVCLRNCQCESGYRLSPEYLVTSVS